MIALDLDNGAARLKLVQFWPAARQLGLRNTDLAALIACNLAGAVLEAIGVAALLPVFQFVQANGQVDSLIAESQMWAAIDALFAFAGLPISLAGLLSFSFLTLCARQAFFFGRTVLLNKIRQRLLRDARNATFDAYLQADSSYHDRMPIGTIINMITVELLRAVDNIMSPLQLLNHLTVALCWLATLVLVSGPYTMAALVAMVLAAGAVFRLVSRTLAIGHQIADASRSMITFLAERLRSPRLVRLSGTEKAELAEMKKLNHNIYTSEVRLQVYNASLEGLLEPLAVGMSFLMLYVGLRFLGLSLEEIGLFLVIALMRLLPVVKEIMRSGQGVFGGQGSLVAWLRRYNEMASARETATGTAALTSIGDGIHFDNVAYRYIAEDVTPALNGLTLHLPTGKLTALVGPSGGGKSTLVDMIPRLHRPDAGTITIAGASIETFAIAGLRQAVAYAPQAPQIFNISAREHISLGNPGCDDTTVTWAAKMAGADDFIRGLPQGYDTILGEGGNRLSGGQRQRLDLARALARRAPILILDEPTANLDAESEAAFRLSIQRIRQGTDITLIMIGHRLSTVRDADQIAVLVAGRVHELGPHEELLQQNGWYARAFNIQTEQPGEIPPATLPTTQVPDV